MFIELLSEPFVFGITAPPDTTPPVISDMPSNIIKEITDGSGECIVFWQPRTATDLDGYGRVTLTSNFKPGDTFPIGDTTVIYEGEDEAGNKVTGSFVITVLGKVLYHFIFIVPVVVTEQRGEGRNRHTIRINLTKIFVRNLYKFSHLPGKCFHSFCPNTC